ncbi:hypothetical protein ACFOEZ_12510 [Tianweitania populi]|uniref:hypothetical protein n=1 Tax=Tianweitania populi TaxID=1607949 RepID=UPI001FCE7EFC|nr:hypothetical protein [Tianweitania populi]
MFIQDGIIDFGEIAKGYNLRAPFVVADLLNIQRYQKFIFEQHNPKPFKGPICQSRILQPGSSAALPQMQVLSFK